MIKISRLLHQPVLTLRAKCIFLPPMTVMHDLQYLYVFVHCGSLQTFEYRHELDQVLCLSCIPDSDTTLSHTPPLNWFVLQQCTCNTVARKKADVNLGVENCSILGPMKTNVRHIFHCGNDLRKQCKSVSFWGLHFPVHNAFRIV